MQDGGIFHIVQGFQQTLQATLGEPIFLGFGCGITGEVGVIEQEILQYLHGFVGQLLISGIQGNVEGQERHHFVRGGIFVDNVLGDIADLDLAFGGEGNIGQLAQVGIVAEITSQGNAFDLIVGDDIFLKCISQVFLTTSELPVIVNVLLIAAYPILIQNKTTTNIKK